MGWVNSYDRCAFLDKISCKLTKSLEICISPACTPEDEPANDSINEFLFQKLTLAFPSVQSLTVFDSGHLDKFFRYLRNIWHLRSFHIRRSGGDVKWDGFIGSLVGWNTRFFLEELTITLFNTTSNSFSSARSIWNNERTPSSQFPHKRVPTGLVASHVQ